ncbi:hypothetical protein [Bacillus sp. 0102A]|uniref:hypothetical protein n=1 Tax=Bacillus sp. 0102A TaxID=3120563 RepID=UPI002FDB010E
MKFEIEKAQEYLDMGYSRTRVAEILGVHHMKITRLVERGLLEIYEAFDENNVPKSALHKQFQEEDYLDDLMNNAFNGPVIINSDKDNRFYDIGKYVRDFYGSVRDFIINKKQYHLLDEIFVRCNCGDVVSISEWYVDKTRLWGLYSGCPRCSNMRSASYLKRNPQVIFNLNMKRRSVIDFDITKDEFKKVRRQFGWKCAISSSNEDVTLDHFIPVAWGFYSHYYENLIPLSRKLNSSKKDYHPIKWLDMKSDLFGEPKKVLQYLSELSGLTMKEFEAFVEWCYQNKNKYEGDSRYPIEIWREQAGRPFPLPAYTTTYNSNESINEKQAR